MLNSVLSILHHAVTLWFGVYLSAAFLGIRMSRKNIGILFGFSAAVSVVSALSFIFFGAVFTAQVYPLIIHLPLILFLTLFYRYNALRCVLSVLIAYLCCQISKWVGLAMLDITGLEWVYYSVRIVTTVVVFAVLMRFVSNAAAQLMQKPTGALLIFSILPFTYYLFDYVTGVYTTLIYSGKEVVAEFLGFVLCIAYLLFLLVYFKQYEEKREAEQRSRILEMQQAQSQKEMEAQKRSAYTVSLLRHDMRHFLTTISAYIDSGECDKAKEYISGIVSYVDRTAMHKFCKNEIVNMILSSYENVMAENRIDFQPSICIPEHLPVSDVDLTSILSNALENAIHAVLPLEAEKRHIALSLRMDDDKLLISVKNTFAEKPVMTDGIPHSRKAGHGFGTQSIRYVTEKLNGNCQFSVKDDWFVLRVIL
ncbi:MAG: GHKL domain-containing protein [Acutalibacteraceae bacterium]